MYTRKFLILLSATALMCHACNRDDDSLAALPADGLFRVEANLGSLGEQLIFANDNRALIEDGDSVRLITWDRRFVNGVPDINPMEGAAIALESRDGERNRAYVRKSDGVSIIREFDDRYVIDYVDVDMRPRPAIDLCERLQLCGGKLSVTGDGDILYMDPGNAEVKFSELNLSGTGVSKQLLVSDAQLGLDQIHAVSSRYSTFAWLSAEPLTGDDSVRVQLKTYFTNESSYRQSAPWTLTVNELANAQTIVGASERYVLTHSGGGTKIYVFDRLLSPIAQLAYAASELTEVPNVRPYLEEGRILLRGRGVDRLDRLVTLVNQSLTEEVAGSRATSVYRNFFTPYVAEDLTGLQISPFEYSRNLIAGNQVWVRGEREGLSQPLLLTVVGSPGAEIGYARFVPSDDDGYVYALVREAVEGWSFQVARLPQQ